MKKLIALSCSVLVSTLFGQDGRTIYLTKIHGLIPGKSIEPVDRRATSIKITVPAVTLRDIESAGLLYQTIGIESFSVSNDLGAPGLPVMRFSLTVPPGMEPRIRVIKQIDTIIEGVLAAPVLDWGVISSDPAKKSRVARNESIYSKNSPYPSMIATVRETGIYRGNEIAFFEVYPVACNPVRKELRVSKVLELEVIMTPASSSEPVETRGSFCGEAPVYMRYGNQNTDNAKGSADQTVQFDAATAIDVIIITIPALKGAADSLALWHAMKGYATRIVTASSWTTASVKDSVSFYYKKTTPAPKYLLLLGDMAQIPLMTATFDGETAYTDYNYALMDGTSDKIPDLARGRIPANTIAEANAAVRKIIKFEKTPPSAPSFYSSVLAAACFQPEDGSTTNEHHAYRFSKTVEDARQYLAGKSYTVTRAYVTESPSVNPKKWWSGNSLVDVPAELQKPQFAWNATAAAVNASINGGVFLAYHYDHGYGAGWSDPSWTVSNMSLNNNDLLPVIYSINCETGMLQSTAKCFAEKLILAEKGGAVAVIAASAVTYAEQNIVFIKGLIEVTWPGYAGDGKNGSPVYTLGDILDKALIRIQNLDDFTKKEYLLFGDPTTKLVTRQPAAITANHALTVNKNAQSFALSAVSVTGGIATLVDKKTATCYGKATIQGPTVQVPISGTIPDTADLVLTITGTNCVPYQSAVGIGNSAVKHSGLERDRKGAFLRIEHLPPIVLEFSEAAMIAIYNPLGRLLYTNRISGAGASVTVSNCLKASGVYCLRVRYARSGASRFYRLLWNK